LTLSRGSTSSRENKERGIIMNFMALLIMPPLLDFPFHMRHKKFKTDVYCAEVTEVIEK